MCALGEFVGDAKPLRPLGYMQKVSPIQSSTALVAQSQKRNLLASSQLHISDDCGQTCDLESSTGFHFKVQAA